MYQEPSIITIFGVTGDLSRKKLLPALYNLATSDRLNPRFVVVGFGRREWGQDEFRAFLAETLAPIATDPVKATAFLDKCYYQRGEFDQGESYEALTSYITKTEEQWQQPALHLFYLATAPEFFITISQHLHKAQLTKNVITPRILLEKPYGSDLRSAKHLNQTLENYFKEDQIFRVDHYLAKVAVRNILSFRNGDPRYAELWDRAQIDHVQLTLAETIGIESRGGYYDETGAVRDVLQNHALELIALVLLDEPDFHTVEGLRDNRTQIFRSLKVADFVTGQYAGYTNEENIPPDSTTETFIAVKFLLQRHGQSQIPIYIRAGKMLKDHINEISITFKPHPTELFPDAVPISITFRIQPNPEIRALARPDDPPNKPLSVNMVHNLTSEPDFAAHEQIIIDCMEGSQQFFVRSDEAEAAWQAVSPILEQLAHRGPEKYQPGTSGPESANQLIAKDSRHWELTIDPAE